MYINGLQKFQITNLESIKAVSLTNRVESKYMVQLNHLPTFLESLSASFLLLNIDDEAICNYHTSYLDTINLNMYLDHHRGKVNRFKIRLRRYNNTKSAFLEIKRKDNKGKTHKNRVIIPFDTKDSFDTYTEEFVLANSPYHLSKVVPILETNYDRIALVDYQNLIRITIDTNLTITHKGNSKQLSEFCIIEIKKEGNGTTSVEAILHQLGYHKFSISKYCLGVYHFLDVKKNKFKTKFRKLEKLMV